MKQLLKLLEICLGEKIKINRQKTFFDSRDTFGSGLLMAVSVTSIVSFKTCFFLPKTINIIVTFQILNMLLLCLFFICKNAYVAYFV